ncbi:P-type DNA transfer protein VirB5 [Caballeronia sp. TF1N1]|uniref:P-type DNA transfer protein VirB5 n=1 Tax=Caballeronia sp. TF1N1 TaxID=2878153 RepID=UPI001FD1BEA4|nr:P-type DNA transfer protein VirB5 [Caballeronia sp. TF1N1]
MKTAFCLALIFAASAASAQVPVTVTSDIPGLAFHTEDIAKFTAQLEQMKLQVQQLQQTYASLNGSTGIGSLFSNPMLRNALPADWQGVYSAVQSGGYSGISGTVNSIIAAEKATIGGPVDQAQAAIVARQAQKAVYDKAMGQSAYDATISRLNNIEGLARQIDLSSSPKQVMDLQARISAEQTSIQNEQTELQLMSMLQRNEDALIERQKDQVSARVLSSANRAIPGLGD